MSGCRLAEVDCVIGKQLRITGNESFYDLPGDKSVLPCYLYDLLPVGFFFSFWICSLEQFFMMVMLGSK